MDEKGWAAKARERGFYRGSGPPRARLSERAGRTKRRLTRIGRDGAQSDRRPFLDGKELLCDNKETVPNLVVGEGGPRLDPESLTVGCPTVTSQVEWILEQDLRESLVPLRTPCAELAVAMHGQGKLASFSSESNFMTGGHVANVTVEEKVAKHGEKMIQVSVKFWTDGIASEEGHVLPGYCWEGGFVNVEANATHSLKATQPIPFNTLDELVPILISALDDAGVNILFNKRKRSRRPKVRG